VGLTLVNKGDELVEILGINKGENLEKFRFGVY
jgi:hypothetical protein